ncbi:MAG: patatin-like phospholipase family protein [Alphaproteobacteria bacterium]|nr:patatin-like phospholipase family protein [Alphaproteobacteria bacterium]
MADAVGDLAERITTLRYVLLRDDAAAGPTPDGAAGVPVAWRVHAIATPGPDPQPGDAVGAVWLLRDDAGGCWWGPYVGADWTGRATGRQEALRSATEACLDATAWSVPVVCDVVGDDARWAKSLRRLGMVEARRDASGSRWRLDPASVPGADGLRHILLGLSGGGLRASGFAVGALSLLEDTGVLGRVRSVTSVSGGSIASGAWIASRARGEGFAEHLQRFRAFLAGQGPAGRSSRIALIQQVADVLDTGVLRGPTGSLALADVSTSPEDPEVVFQTTELTRAGSFVYVAGTPSGGKHGALPGADGLRPGRELMRRVRLADAVACSAAFPVGFAPVRFPGDLVLDATTRADLVAACAAAAENGWPDPSGTCLVDGGVYDNQGIAGMKDAWERYDDSTDVVLVVDADQTDPSQAAFTWGPSLPAGLGWLLSLLVGAGIVGAIALWGWAPFVAVGLLAAAAWLAVQIAVVALPGRLMPPGVTGWRLALPHNLVPAVVVRGRVAVLLLAVVFMRRVRRLAYDTIYGTPIPERVVRGMASIDRLPERGVGPGDVAPDTKRTENDMVRWRYPSTEALQQAGVVARAVPTVLRLADPDAEVPALVTAGRATAALALLKRVHLLGVVRRPAMRAWLVRLEHAWATMRVA